MEHGSPPPPPPPCTGNFKQARGTGHHEVWEGGPWGGNGESDMGLARTEGPQGAGLLARKEPGRGAVEGQRRKAVGFVNHSWYPSPSACTGSPCPPQRSAKLLRAPGERDQRRKCGRGFCPKSLFRSAEWASVLTQSRVGLPSCEACPGLRLGFPFTPAPWEKEQFRVRLRETAFNLGALLKQFVEEKKINGLVKNVKCLGTLCLGHTKNIKREFLFSGKITNWEEKLSKIQLRPASKWALN